MIVKSECQEDMFTQRSRMRNELVDSFVFDAMSSTGDFVEVEIAKMIRLVEDALSNSCSRIAQINQSIERGIYKRPDDIARVNEMKAKYEASAKINASLLVKLRAMKS